MNTWPVPLTDPPSAASPCGPAGGIVGRLANELASPVSGLYDSRLPVEWLPAIMYLETEHYFGRQAWNAVRDECFTIRPMFELIPDHDTRVDDFGEVECDACYSQEEKDALP